MNFLVIDILEITIRLTIFRRTYFIMIFKSIFIATTFIIAAIAIFTAIDFYPKTSTSIPELSDINWRPGGEFGNDNIIPFQIDVADEVINNLKSQLRNTILTPPLEGIKFEYGMNTKHLQKIIDYWINKYDWKKRQVLLNSVPQFKTKINGLDIHFIHLKPCSQSEEIKQVVPLLMLHGWVGSIKEFYKIFPLLIKLHPDYDFVFELVVPSMPGFGFSQGATVPGFDPAYIGLIMKKLMVRLGFEKFYVLGGDWGGITVNNMATLFPENVVGHVSTFCMFAAPLDFRTMISLLAASYFPSLFVDDEQFQKKLSLSRNFHFLMEESGYFHLQATKPDTVGVALQNSPAGLASYLLEKFSTLTNADFRFREDGGLMIPFNLKNDSIDYTMDDLLDNIMIYWITNSITTSMRIYAEGLRLGSISFLVNGIPTKVPTSCTNYPNEIFYIPENIARRKFPNLLQYKHMPKGGHFAAFQLPELFANDTWQSVDKIRKFIRFKNNHQ